MLAEKNPTSRATFLRRFFWSLKRIGMNRKVKIKKHYSSYKNANKMNTEVN